MKRKEKQNVSYSKMSAIELKIDLHALTPMDLQFVVKWIQMIAQDKQNIINEQRVAAEVAARLKSNEVPEVPQQQETGEQK